MSLSQCRCGAPIQWAATVDGDRIPLDPHEAPKGDVRYRVLEYASPWLVELLDIPDRSGMPDHRLACPAVSAPERQAIIQKALRGDDVRTVDAGPREGQRGSAPPG